MPLFSGLSANAEEDVIRRVFLASSRYVVSIIFAMGTGAFLLGVPFITVWLGPEFGEKAQWLIVFLIVFTVLPFINPFASRYLTAINKHGIFAKLTPMAAAINFGLSLMLVHPFGLEGVAFASVVPGLIFVPIYLHYTCRQIGLKPITYLKAAVAPGLLPAGLMATVLVVVGETLVYDSYMAIVSGAALASLVWLISFWFWVLSREERAYLGSRVAGRLRGKQ
ncbi:MAG: hypothetical protein B7X58_09890 [Marinobacter sp. 34-60-7]|nr:MAG: hypothetical protein B7X58_09890 [Marinobacter sp. 34-60-7]